MSRKAHARSRRRQAEVCEGKATACHQRRCHQAAGRRRSAAMTGWKTRGGNGTVSAAGWDSRLKQHVDRGRKRDAANSSSNELEHSKDGGAAECKCKPKTWFNQEWENTDRFPQGVRTWCVRLFCRCPPPLLRFCRPEQSSTWAVTVNAWCTIRTCHLRI